MQGSVSVGVVQNHYVIGHYESVNTEHSFRKFQKTVTIDVVYCIPDCIIVIVLVILCMFLSCTVQFQVDRKSKWFVEKEVGMEPIGNWKLVVEKKIGDWSWSARLRARNNLHRIEECKKLCLIWEIENTQKILFSPQVTMTSRDKIEPILATKS